MANAVTVLSDEIYGVRDTFASVLTDKHLSFEKEAGFAIQTITANDYLFKIATSNRQSVINAVTNIAAIGISLNPAKKQAYLVPRDGRVCLDISYMGLMDLAIQSGSILWGQAELVHDADKFALNGFDKPPRHERNPFSKDRGALVGAYVVVKTSTGDYLTTCMSIDEVFDIRNRSSAWKAWVDKKRSCPWVTDEGEMIKKTVIKRAYKMWPKTDRLDTAVHYLNTDGGEGLDEILSQPMQQTSAMPSGPITPTSGAMASMSTDVQIYLRDLAEELVAMFNNPEFGIELMFDRYEAENLESEQKVAIWTRLPSSVRAAIKAEGKKREEAKATA
jgi:recombination protein RecT